MLGLARALVATRGGTAVARARLAPRRVAPVRLGGRAHLATRIDVIDDAPAFATLVQGASRGIGLELARQMLERDADVFRGRARGGIVVATCRDPEGSDGLRALRARHGTRLVTARVDVEEEETMKAAVDVVMREVGRLDFMANVSAVLSDGKMRPETSIARTEAGEYARARTR